MFVNSQKRISIRTGLLATAVLATGAFDVAAQTSALVLEEIIVTANRRETNLQTTSAAISAFTADDMTRRSIRDLEDVGLTTPSLHVSVFQGEAQVYMRGIGTPIVIGGTDSATAIHNDGVYLSRAAASVPAFFDVERIEVIRGPQGTLYGRNATAGSLNVISKAPTEEFEGEVRVNFGNYNDAGIFAAIGGPLVEDKVLFRAAAQFVSRDGYTTVERPAALDPSPTAEPNIDDVEDKEEYYLRVKTEFRPSEDVTFTLTGDYYKADDKASVWHFLNEGPRNAPAAIFNDFVEANGRFPEDASRTMFSEQGFFNKPEIWGVSGDLSWDVGGGYSINSLTAYRETKPFNRNDLDMTDAAGSDQTRAEDHWQFSQELQLSSPEGERLEWILGAFYFEEDNVVRNEYFVRTIPDFVAGFGIGAAAQPCCLLLLNGTTETTAYAVFADGSYDFTDQLSLIFGARYSYEKRDGSNIVVFEDLTSTAFDNVFEFEETSWNAFTPKAGLEYAFNDDLFGYFSATRGFKSGGFNLGSYQNEPFDPEFIWSYEAGLKGTFLDGRLSLNTAAFYYDYSDLQVQDVEQNNVRVENAASARIFGIEIDGVFIASEQASIDFAFAYLNSEFKDFVSEDPKRPALGSLDLSGNSLPKAPEFTASIGAQYQFPVGSEATFTLRGDFTWQSEIFFSSFQDDLQRQGAFPWLKLRGTYAPDDADWQLAVFADNLTNETVITNAIYTGDIVGSRAAGNLAPPRTWGAEFQYRF